MQASEESHCFGLVFIFFWRSKRYVNIHRISYICSLFPRLLSHTHTHTHAHALKTKIFLPYMQNSIMQPAVMFFNQFVHLFRIYWIHQIQRERNNMATAEILNRGTKDDVRRQPQEAHSRRRAEWFERIRRASLGAVLLLPVAMFCGCVTKQFVCVSSPTAGFRVTMCAHPPLHLHTAPPRRSLCGLCGLSHPISLSAPLSPSSTLISPSPLCL